MLKANGRQEAREGEGLEGRKQNVGLKAKGRMVVNERRTLKKEGTEGRSKRAELQGPWYGRTQERTKRRALEVVMWTKRR